MATQPTSIYRFGLFELDLRSGELRRNGTKLKIQEQPLQVLAMLLAEPGAVVTREELRNRLWPADTFVDFDHSINAAIKRLREALSDETENPRFIETLPRRGYRFIGPVDAPPKTTPGGTAHKIRRPIVYKFALGLVVAGLLSATVWFYFSRRVESKLPSARVVPFQESAGGPAFSPDGNYIAFSRFSDSPETSGIYIKQIGSNHQLQLTRNEHDYVCCPVWSPDGRYIAFSRFPNNKHTINVISAIGGAERKLLSDEPAHPPVDWSPDGKFIAFTAKDSDRETYSLFSLAVDNLEKHKLTAPPLEHQDWGPAFSPDGKQLAFIRTNSDLGDIYLMPANGGEPHRLTFDHASIPTPPAWTRDGQSIVFSSTRTSIPTLWTVPVAGGEPVQVPQVGVVTVHPAVSPKGHRLAYEQMLGSSSIWSMEVAKIGNQDFRTQVTASKGDNWAPEFSPDGKKVVFESDRFGPMEIWTCNRDGSNPSQLTHLGGPQFPGPPRWSPDGQRIAFDSAIGDHNAIFIVNAEGGLPRALTHEGSDSLNPSWSRDGKWIYFSSIRTGEWQIWKLPSEGGDPVQVTRHGGHEAFESADGKFIYYAKTPSGPDIWRMRLGDGHETPLSPQIHVQHWGNWALAGNGVFFLSEESAPHPVMRFFDFATSSIKNVATLEKPVTWKSWISASADGKVVLFGQNDLDENNIMLLENFR